MTSQYPPIMRFLGILFIAQFILNSTMDGQCTGLFNDLPPNTGESTICTHTEFECASSNLENEATGIIYYSYTESDNGEEQYGTGVVLVDTNLSDTTYFLTSSSLVNDAIEAASMQLYFSYVQTGCSPNIDTIICSSNPTLITSSSTLDYSLLSINLPSDMEVFHNGWDASNNLPDATSSIHYPQGTTQKLAHSIIIPNISTFGSFPPSSHWEVTWNNGGTETGSIGAPLFTDEDALVVGILSAQTATTGCSPSSFFQQYAEIHTELEATLANNSHLKKFEGTNYSDCNNHFEPNNSSFYASDIFKPFVAGDVGFVKSYIYADYDTDYFMLTLESSGVLNLGLSEGGNDYDITLYAKNNIQLTQSSGGSDNIEWENPFSLDTFFVKIHSATGNAGCIPYKLEVSVDACTGIDNAGNSPSNAHQVSDGSQETGYLSSTGEEDYYSIDLSGVGVLEVNLEIPTGYDYHLDISPSSSVNITNSGDIIELILTKTSNINTEYIINISSMGNYTLCAAYTLELNWTESTGATDTPSDPTDDDCIPILLNISSTPDNTDTQTNTPDGSVTVMVISGNPPFTYEWDTSTGSQTTATAVGLAAGTYSVDVTGSDSCIATTSVTINGCTGGVPNNFACCINNAPIIVTQECAYYTGEILENVHTPSGLEIPACDSPGNNDTYSSFIVPNSGIVRITSIQDPSGNSAISDLGLGIYAGDCSNPVYTGLCVQNSLPYNDYMPDTMSINLSAYIGQILYLRFWEFGYVPQYGTFKFCIVEGNVICDRSIINLVESVNETSPISFGEDVLVEGQEQSLQWRIAIVDPTFSGGIVGIYNEMEQVHTQEIIGTVGDTFAITPSISVTELMGSDTGQVYEYRILLQSNTYDYNQMTASSPLICTESVRVYTPQIQVLGVNPVRREAGDTITFKIKKNFTQSVDLTIVNTVTQEEFSVNPNANFSGDSTAFYGPLGVWEELHTLDTNMPDGSYILRATDTDNPALVAYGGVFFIGECIDPLHLYDEETLFAMEFLCFNDLIPADNDSTDVVDSPILLEDACILAYDALNFIQDENPAQAITAQFPVPFGNLQEEVIGVNDAFFHKARFLMYLQYGDEHSAMPRNWFYFPSKLEVSKGLAIRLLLETFDVKQGNPTSDIFLDVPNSHPYAPWVNQAYILGLIPDMQGGNFQPDAPITKEWFYRHVFRIMTNYQLNQFIPLAEFEEEDIYTPGNYSPESIPYHLGSLDGVLNVGGDAPITIPGAGMDIGFAFGYTSLETDLPIEFYREPHLGDGYDFQPMGTAWSHNYNLHILYRKDTVSNQERYIIISSGGKALTFNPNPPYKNGQGHFDAPSIYDEVYFSGMDDETIIITTKAQMDYTFQEVAGKDYYQLVSVTDRFSNMVSLYYGNNPVNGENDRLESATETHSGGGDPDRYIKYGYDQTTHHLNLVWDEGMSSQLDLLSGSTYREVSFIYDNKERLRDYIDVMGNPTNYQYNDNNPTQWTGLLTKVTFPAGNSVHITCQKNKIRNLRVGKNATTYDWIPSYDASSTTAFVEYTSTRVTSVANITVEYIKDGMGRMWKSTTPTSIAEVQEYDTGNNLMLATEMTNNDITYETGYDDRGNTIDAEISSGGLSISTSYSYDSYNNLRYYTAPRGETYEMTYFNGGLGGLEKIILPDNIGEYLATRLPDGRLETWRNPEGIEVTFNYDSINSFLESIYNTSHPNLESSFLTDDLARIQQVIDPNENTSFADFYRNSLMDVGLNAEGYPTSFDYTDNYLLEKVTDANNKETELGYTDGDEQYLQSQSFGSDSYIFFSHEKDGLLKSVQKRGETKYYIRDGQSRLLLSDPTNDYEYTTDGRYNLRKVSSKVYGNSIEFVHDPLNRVTGVIYKDENGNIDRTGYNYDDAGNVTHIYYEGLDVNSHLFYVRYEYDSLNRCTQIYRNTIIGGTEELIVSYEYFSDGRIKHEIKGNGTKTVYLYDTAGRPSGIFNYLEDGTLICANHYELDDAGYHTSETFRVPGSDAATPQFTFTSSEYDDSPYNRSEGYTQNGEYHDIGHDASGNVTSLGDWEFQWDFNDQLRRVRQNSSLVATYGYDGLGHRRHKEFQNDPHVIKIRYGLDLHGMGNVLAEHLTFTDGNQWDIYYIHGPQGLVCRLIGYNNPDDVTEYYHYDYRGSTLAMTNNTPTVQITHCYRYEHDGLVTHSVGQPYTEDFPNAFIYVGQWGVQKEVGELYFMRARYMYQPMGNFLSEDPVWHANLYTYAGNNPVDFIDPTGNVFFMAYIPPNDLCSVYGTCGNSNNEDQENVIIDSNTKAVSHYYYGEGKEVTLGPKTQKHLKNNKKVTNYKNNIISGSTRNPAEGSGLNANPKIPINRSFHVGRIALSYSTICNENNCTTTYILDDDGFVDPNSLSRSGDGDGPSAELGGTPYNYAPIIWTETYPNPGYEFDEGGVPSAMISSGNN